jgi:hypothetical protein
MVPQQPLSLKTLYPLAGKGVTALLKQGVED